MNLTLVKFAKEVGYEVTQLNRMELGLVKISRRMKLEVEALLKRKMTTK